MPKVVRDDAVAETVRARLLWLRQTRDQTRDEVARGTGLASNTVWRHESGNGRVDVSALVLYARHYGAPVDWLLGYQGCGNCGDNPPEGFTCNACAAGKPVLGEPEG